MKEVTVEWLKSQEACSDQVALFEAAFGQSAKITKRNLLKAASAGLNIEWLAQRCLKGKSWRAYGEARAAASRAYDEATAIVLWDALKLQHNGE